jgi:phage/plasmid-like protein (TIGR03299 family)
MAHAIRQVEGKAQMFLVGERSWHGLEQKIDNPTSLDEGMQTAGHLYTVETVPSYQKVTTSTGDEFYREVPQTRYTVRTDTQERLGTVGSGYVPIQNYDAFRGLEPLLDRGLAVLESGATLYNGSDVFMTVRFNAANSEVRDFRERHGLKSYGLMHNNHSGQHKLCLQNTDVRVVCRNTLRMALAGGTGQNDRILIRHTKHGTKSTIEAARDLWGRISANQTKAMQDYDLMMRTFLTDAEFERLVLDVVLPLPTKKPDTPRGQTMYDKKLLQRAEVTNRWLTGLGHSGEPDAWHAYNGAIECMDHDPSVFTMRGTTEDRMFSVLAGPLNALKQDLANSLVKFALAK